MNHNQQQKTALVVLGMHRSGTSALTRILSLLGADLPSTLLEPGDDNPTGFWESLKLMQIHDEILQSLGLTWHAIDVVDPNWHATQAGQTFRKRLLEYLRTDFADSSLFVLKDPRMCRLVPLWRQTLADFGARTKFIRKVLERFW